MVELVKCVWYTDSKNKRVIFAQVGDEPDYDNDPMIGAMDDWDCAAEVVEAHNRKLAAEIRNEG